MSSEAKRMKRAYSDDIKIERSNKMTKLEEIEACGPEHGNDLTVIKNFYWLVNRVKELEAKLEIAYAEIDERDLKEMKAE